MSRKAVTVIALGALLTFLGVVAFHKSANYLLGYSLRALFESETGCDVTLRHPRISFFPLRGEVSDVSIRHRTEKPGQGFFAERVTVRPDISGIFSKIVLLRDLRVEGAHAFATQKESGFYNTIDFVASDSPPNPNRPWHAFVSRGWSIRVYEISVTPRAQEDHTLVLRTGKARVAFDQLHLSFVRQSHNSPPLFDTRGEAKLFSVLGRELQRKIGAVSATGVIGQGKFRLANGTIRPEGFEGETRVTGELDLPGEGEHHLNATGELSPEYIASLVPEIRELTLARGMRGTFSAAISGPLEEPVFTGTTLATFTSVAESADGTLCDVRTLGFHNVVSTETVEITKLELDGHQEEGRLDLTFAGDMPLRAAFVTSPGRPGGYLERCVNTQSLTSDALARLRDVKVRIAAEGMASPLALTFDVSSPAGEQELRLLGIPTIHARLDPTHVNVVLRDATPNASADVAVNYDYERGNIVVDRVQFDSYPLKRLASLVSPFHRGARLLDRILLPESNAQGRIDGLRFDGGNATAGKGTLAVAPVSLHGVYAQRLSVDVSASAQQLSLAPIVLTANQGRLRADVQLKNDGSLSGDLRSEGFTVESIAGTDELPLGLQGALNVTGKLSGTVDAPQFEVDGELQANALAAEVRGPKSTFAVRGSAENVDAKISLFDSSGSFQIEAPLHSSGESVSLKGSATRLPIVYLIPQPATRDVPSTQGELDGSVDFRGPLGDPLAGQGAITISRVRLNDGKIAMRESAPFAWKLASGVLSFGETRFSIQERELLLSGEVSHARGWNAQLAGSWELGKFIGEQAGLEQISGTVGIDLDIRGPAYQPAVGGPVRLEDGSISFPLGNTIVGANSVDVDALFVGDRLEITSIAAQVQDGEISGSGMIDHVFDSEQRRISISTKLEAVSTEPIENFFIVLDGQLHLEQQPTGLPILSGDVVISQGSYDATIDLAGIVRAMTNAILGANKTSATLVSAPSRSKSATTALNVRIRADDSVIVDTNVVKALLRGDMVLTGTSDRPLLNGSIDAVEGVFGLRSNQFEIVKGRLLFSEKDQRLDPQIEFISEAQVNSDGDPYLIRLSIGGALSKPRVRFDSDGGLSEREVVALLGGGGGLDRISLLRGSRSASRRVGVLLNPVSNASFEERFVGLTGFTSVEIGPSYSKTTGEYVPKLFARRPLVGELDLELDTELGGDERSTVGVQYPLNNSLRLDVGWQNVPVTKDLSSSSGSFHVGLHYRETFPGYRLFPSFSRSRIVREQDAPVSETPTPPVKESPP